MEALDQPVDKTSDTSPNKNKQETGKTIALILVITLVAIAGVVVILVAIALGLNKVNFSEAKDILSLILVAIGSLTGSAVGFYFGSLSRLTPID
jgi:uncharacterized membrane protein